MQVASSKQNEEDARSGVNKVISSMKSVSRPPQQSYDNFPSYTPYSRSRYPEPQQFDGFDDGF
jgi:hypothetical protein